METIIGFVVGYLVGSREGKAGLARARESFHAIATSPEVRRLATNAVSMAEAAARQSARGGLGKLGGAVVRSVTGRMSAEPQCDTPRAA